MSLHCQRVLCNDARSRPSFVYALELMKIVSAKADGAAFWTRNARYGRREGWWIENWCYLKPFTVWKGSRNVLFWIILIADTTRRWSSTSHCYRREFQFWNRRLTVTCQGYETWVGVASFWSWWCVSYISNNDSNSSTTSLHSWWDPFKDTVVASADLGSHIVVTAIRARYGTIDSRKLEYAWLEFFWLFGGYVMHAECECIGVAVQMILMFASSFI